MRLPVVSGNQIIKLLEKEGFTITRQKGSHISLHKKLEQKLSSFWAYAGNIHHLNY